MNTLSSKKNRLVYRPTMVLGYKKEEEDPKPRRVTQLLIPYPEVKMPEPVHGYIKPKKYDCL